MPVEAVLIHCILHALRKVRLQLNRSDRQAIQKEDEVDAIFTAFGVANLPDDAQAVGRIPRHDRRVDARCRTKLRQRDLALHREQLDAVSQNIQGARVSRFCRSWSSSRVSAERPCPLASACHASGCDSCTHAITSSGNNARVRSYCAETLSSNIQPCTPRCSAISCSK